MIYEIILVKPQHKFNRKHANKFPTVYKYPHCEMRMCNLDSID